MVKCKWSINQWFKMTQVISQEREKHMWDKLKERQAGRQADKQTDRQVDRQANRHTYRQAGRPLAEGGKGNSPGQREER